MTHLVHPGARRSRFEHSLGVRQITARLADEIKMTEADFSNDQHRIVRLAALLHDVGRGPFSHTSENVLDDRAGVEGVHEPAAAAIIRTDPDLACAPTRTPEARGPDRTVTVPSVERKIVCGPTETDKLDYLLRDSYYRGVEYG